jgi:hypothetical protein
MILVLRSRNGAKEQAAKRSTNNPKRPVRAAAKENGIATSAPPRRSSAYVTDPRRLHKADAMSEMTRPRQTASHAGKVVVKVPISSDAYARMQRARMMNGPGSPRQRQH